jgi:alkylated DNA repair dioxygenase AlkB
MSTTLLDSGSIHLLPRFVPDHRELYERLVAAVAWDARLKARKAMSFGVPYNYSGIEWPAAPFPATIAELLPRVAEAVGFAPNNCLAHYYPDGDSTMGFHFDSTDELDPGTGIVVVSLGSERTMTFRTFDKKLTERHALAPGSLLWMSPEMQSNWRHAILADATAKGGRISLTFRRMKA